ncbi:hypothetical protein [Stetteria hydrogenophila]
MQAYLPEIEAYLDMLKAEMAKLKRLKEALSSRKGASASEALSDVWQWEIILKRVEAYLAQITYYMEYGSTLKASAEACAAHSFVKSVITRSSQLTGLAGHIYQVNLQALMAKISDVLWRICRVDVKEAT